jgi:copper(I)-binding protein
MNRMARIVCTVLFLTATAAHAHGYAIGEVRVQHPWASATAASTREALVFMRIYNQGHAPERLLSATSAVAKCVELRTGASPTASIALPARKSITLEPGGLHLLLADLERPLPKGERFILLLRFERSGELSIEVEVQSADSKRPRH